MAGLFLSELGFEVIKIEQPGKGDVTRSLTGSSAGNFVFLNRGKKSVTLDLKNDLGRRAFMKLVEKSEVVIDNLGPETMNKMILGYEELIKVNPKLVYLKIKGFGPGPHGWRKSLDFPAEVESGIAYMNGLEGKPMRLGASVIDIFAASIGVISVLRHLLDRKEGSGGVYTEVALFETGVFLMGPHMASAQILGLELKPLNTEPFMWGIYDFFETSDAKNIFIAVTTDSQWKSFREAFQFKGPGSDEELRTNDGRYRNRYWLIPSIARTIKRMPLREVTRLLSKSNVAYGTLNRSLDLIENDQLKFGGKLARIRTPDFKKIAVPRLPIYNRDGSLDFALTTKDPPSLGYDTASVLQSVGFSEGELEEMRKQHAI